MVLCILKIFFLLTSFSLSCSELNLVGLAFGVVDLPSAFSAVTLLVVTGAAATKPPPPVV